MNLKKIIGVVLIAAGVLALVYKGFNYTKETHGAKIGPLEFQMKQKERVEIPVWLGVVLIAAGGVVLVLPSKK
jgi:uncharacterized membrane protein